MKMLYLLMCASVFFLIYSGTVLYCKNDVLEVTFLNIGQGDAVYIRFPNNVDVLIDTGPHNVITDALADVMSFFNTSFDILFITHMDSDHHGGIISLQKNFTINYFAIASAFESNDQLLLESLRSMRKDTTLTHLERGDRIVIDSESNIFFEVLHPPVSIMEDDVNEQSLVLRLVYNNISFLFTGDISKHIEEDIIATYPDYIISTVLKLAHHGSRTSSGEKFLKAVNPQYAIISAGVDNSYGHPHPEVIDALHRLSIPYKETKNGNIIFYTDGTDLWFKDQEKEKAFVFAECFF